MVPMRCGFLSNLNPPFATHLPHRVTPRMNRQQTQLHTLHPYPSLLQHPRGPLRCFLLIFGGIWCDFCLLPSTASSSLACVFVWPPSSLCVCVRYATTIPIMRHLISVSEGASRHTAACFFLLCLLGGFSGSVLELLPR